MCLAIVSTVTDRGRRGREVRHLQEEVRAMKQAFQHISAIEHLLGEALVCHDTRLTRDRFAKLLSAEVGQDVDDRAVSFVFDAFDTNRDDTITPQEMLALTPKGRVSGVSWCGGAKNPGVSALPALSQVDQILKDTV
mmetsp:Transcript_94530/g.304081  ORF Transcript_94530/g.304081 Transcript_94530/m.304081 type:complete len:137 (+) Transcript_94530:38-448(+)